MIYRTYIKPTIDVLLATIIFVCLFPVIIFLVILLFIANKGNPFFFQHRPGKYGKSFNVIKFKTMIEKRDSMGYLLPDADRLTLIGEIVRKTSLDEIPQLLNVIKGDMSLIGPRPLLVEYLALYNEKQKRRHEVKPGITGWAQVNGRNTITWEQKFEYDVWYVDHISLGLDLKIFLLTISKVFKGVNINQNGQATAQKFGGGN